MSEWIKVEDHLPELFIPVLVSGPWENKYSSRLSVQSVAWLNRSGEWERWTYNGKKVSWKGGVAFWMPIPKTPDTPKENA